jgi:aryl-alcohol dehydrogenase-like predicted oxidoreductase
MVLRALGRSGLRVSPIGFGAFKIGRNRGIKYASAYELPDDAAAGRLLNGVLDLGVNYIDTAPAYGVSEERIGRFLAHRRAEFVISTKVGETFADGRAVYDFSGAAVRASVERSLRRLRIDVLDIVFVHAHADDAGILRETDVVATLRELKQTG